MKIKDKGFQKKLILFALLSFFAQILLLLDLLYLENVILLKANLWLVEIVTIFIVTTLVIEFKKFEPQARSKVVALLCGFLLSILFCYGIVGWYFINNAVTHTNLAKELEKDFNKNPNYYVPIFSTVFGKAETRNVRSDIDDKYYCTFQDYNKAKLCSTDRPPIYFIRLKEDYIEKLYQSGDLIRETVDTPGEKEVVAMLKGEKGPVTFPQYTCCGGDDAPWGKIPFFRFFLSEKRYLKDFYSEMETILLVRDKNGKIIGAVVNLHGD